MDSSASSTEPELRFPSLPIEFTGSATPTLSPHTFCNMDTDSASDTTHDSLADSTYEIISESAVISGDDADSRRDEDESLASFDESAPEDTAGPTGQVQPMTPPDTEPTAQSGPEDFVPPDPTHLNDEPKDTSMEDSNCTEVKTPSLGSIMFEEPGTEATPTITEATHRLSGHIGSSLHGYGKYQPQAGKDEHFVVKQTLSPDVLRLERPFKLLYHGDLAHKEAVVEKVAQALYVSELDPAEGENEDNISSKYNVVQLSSFNRSGAPPQVTIIPSSRIELVIECCQTCCYRKDDDPKSFKTDLSRKMHALIKARNDEDCLSTHVESTLNSQNRPDLAVFYHSFKKSSTDATGADNHTLATNSIDISTKEASLGIPTIDIAPQISAWAFGRYEPYRGQAVHVALETSHPQPPKNSKTISNMPIDLEHFLEIDARQLNRNLACITSARRSLPSPDISLAIKVRQAGHEFFETCKPLLCSFEEWIDTLDVSPLIIGGLLGLVIILLTMAMTMESTSLLRSPNRFDGPRAACDFKAAPPREASTFWSSSWGPGVMAPSQGSDAPAATRSVEQMLADIVKAKANEKALSPVSTQTGVETKPIKTPASAPNSKENLTIVLVQTNDGRRYLQMPEAFARLRRTPQLLIKASSKGKPVHASVAKFNSSTYALDISMDGTTNAVELVVWTEQKPIINQSFTLESGSLWFSLKTLSGMIETNQVSKWANKEIAVLRNAGLPDLSLPSEWVEQARKRRESLWKAFGEQAEDSRSAMSRQMTKAMIKATSGQKAMAKMTKQRMSNARGKALATAERSYRRLSTASIPRINGRPAFLKIETNPIRKARERALSLVNRVEYLPAKLSKLSRVRNECTRSGGSEGEQSARKNDARKGKGARKQRHWCGQAKKSRKLVK